jgi:hypothetical protein
MQFELEGPFSLNPDEKSGIFHLPIGEQSGVYVYAVNVDGQGHLATYVGQTGRSFLIRVREHVLNTLSGYEKIFDPDALKKGEKKLVWDGLWPSDRRNYLGEFLKRYSELAPVIQKFAKQFEIFLLPIQQKDKSLRLALEAGITTHLKAQPTPVGEFMDEIDPKPRKENLVDIEIMNAQKIMGFPTCLRV